MGWWRRKNRDLDEEIAFDLAAEAQERAEAGVPAEEAERSSRRDFGNVLLVKETAREAWGWGWLERLVQDVRYGMRQMARSPGFAVVAVLSLALGIGANAAIFTLINIAMLKALPVSHPEELVVLTKNDPASTKPSGFNGAQWEQIRDRQDILASVFAYGSTRVDLSGGGEARPVPAGFVSGDYFRALGVRASAGRTLTSADDYRGCPAIAVISHGMWQREFGGANDIASRQLLLDGHAFQIVGVTEPAFFGVEYGYDVPIWAPFCAEYRGNMGRWVMGRRKAGVTLGQIRARLAALTPAILEATIGRDSTAQAAAEYRKSVFGAAPFSRGLPALEMDYGDAFWFLMAVTGVVLLISCANLANLLLARATARQREIAVRLALGASRGRLMRQLLTESLLLAFSGAAVGVLFAYWGSRILAGFLSTPRVVVTLDVSPDVNVLAFTIAMAVLTGLLFGFAPAWRAARSDPYPGMKPGGQRAGGGLVRFRGGKALVVAQIALSLVSVACAGLLLGSWRRLVTLDPGFRPDHVLLTGVNTRAAQIPGSQRSATYRRILQRLRMIPGVVAASASAITPLGSRMSIAIDIPGYTEVTGSQPVVQLNHASDGYFATIGTPILAGRDFSGGDVVGAPRVAIVNEEAARRFFGGSRAIGRHFRVPDGRNLGSVIEIVGIVGNTKHYSLSEENQPIVYYSLSQISEPLESMNFALRISGAPADVLPGVKAAIAGIGPRISLTFNTLEGQIAESVRLPRTLGMLSGFFGALSLLLAAIGLYGVMAYNVARRRNEIGVRIALGAAQGRVVRMVLGDVGRMVAAGIGLGVAVSLTAMRLASKFLFGVQANDAATLGFAALVLAAVSLGAARMPARRAARLDPMAALREE